MPRKIQLRLLASKEMSERGEHKLIRFPRKARDNFRFANTQVVIGKADLEVALVVRKAFKPDVQRLATMIRRGQLSEEEALAVGFVTRSVQQRVNKREGESAWISEGVGNITIGADPEFGLVTSGKVLQRGNSVLPNTRFHEFGADGPGVEVRPKPSRSHLGVLDNIEAILSTPPEAVEPYQWLGGATFDDMNRTYWFGGHVHLGRPQTIEADEALGCYSQIAVVLDQLLALPLVRFDTPNPHKRRMGCIHRYGLAGDIRADYPEQDRFEYRVLSGLWLTHPKLAQIVLGVSKCVAETAYNRIAEKRYDYDWVEAPATKKDSLLGSFGVKGIVEAKTLINKALPGSITDDHVQVWESKIRALDLFDTYAAELEALIALVKTDPKTLVPQFNLDLRKSWLEGNPLLPRTPRKTLQACLDALER